MFFLAIFTPFFSNCSFKRPTGILSVLLIVYFAPLIFYPEIYSKTYIDPFVGALAGAGFAAILTRRNKDIFYAFYVLLLCSALVLAKDVGLMFALFLAAAYAADMLLKHKERKTAAICVSSAIAAVVLPKILWNYKIAAAHATRAFSEKIDLLTAVKVFLGQDTSYRSTVLKNYMNALVDNVISLGNLNITLSYVCLGFTMLIFSFLVLQAVKTFQPAEYRYDRTVFFIMHTMGLIYIFGLCVTYMFKFSEYEAVRLASFGRYLGMPFLCILLTNLLVCRDIMIHQTETQNKRYAASLCIYIWAIALLLPWKPILQFAGRDTVTASMSTRAPYEVLIQKIMDISNNGSTVYLISQENNGFDHWIIRYNVRPNYIPHSWGWSLGPPFYDGDIWSNNKSPEQWRNELIADYDYVALYRLNDFFLETYSVLFEDPSQIEENAVYRVDKETELLQKVC